LGPPSTPNWQLRLPVPGTSARREAGTVVLPLGWLARSQRRGKELPMADLVNSDKHPKYGRRPGAESDFPFEAALEGEVSTASSGRSLLGKTRQRIAAKRRRPAAEDDAPDVRKRRTTEPNIMQKLASRECSGTTQLRKFSHSKCFLDMKLNVRCKAAGRGARVSQLPQPCMQGTGMGKLGRAVGGKEAVC
jgi:hypothetical protein